MLGRCMIFPKVTFRILIGKEALEKVADSQKLRDCANSGNNKSDAAFSVSRDNAKKFSAKYLRCNKSGHMKSSCTVKQCFSS